MLNVIAISGRLGRDPELKQTQSGKSVAGFSIACDRGRKDADGKFATDWFDVTAWGGTAEFVCKYFHKGSLIALDGRLQTRKYKDKSGNNRTAVEIVAQNVHFIGSKSDSAAEPTVAYDRPAAENGVAYASGTDADFALVEDDGDLPF